MSASNTTPDTWPRAGSAFLTDIIWAAQLNPDNVTYTTRGVPAAAFAAAIGPYVALNSATITAITNMPNGLAGLDAGGTMSSQKVLPTLANQARALSALFSDAGYNINNYTNAAGQQAAVDALYASVPSGTTITVPFGNTWGGHLSSPVAAKVVTWNFQGAPNLGFGIAAGDGDLTISSSGGSFNLSKSYFSATQFLPSLNIIMENFDATFSGPYRGNWGEMAPVAITTYSGPTATGNTGGQNITLNSYGMGPSSSFDIPLVVSTNKYGQNSIWTHVLVNSDYSGRVPQAFAGWVGEWDTHNNGYDIHPMAPGYWSPGVGTRVFLIGVAATNNPGTWNATQAVSAKSTAQNSLGAAQVVKVTATNGSAYTWYCTQSGTTGATQPTWPAPASFAGSISATGLLTVTALQTGSAALAVGQIVTFGGTITPIYITALGTGTGGVGTYQTNYSGGALGPFGAFGCAPVTDGSAVWNFGTNYASQTSCGIQMGATPDGSSLMTAFNAAGTIISAAYDCSSATLSGAYAAAVRMAPGQVIDFAGGGTQATLNTRTLGYNATDAALEYAVASTKKISFGDAGGLGVFGATPPTTKPTITGSRSGATAAVLESLLQALQAAGFITDSTTA